MQDADTITNANLYKISGPNHVECKVKISGMINVGESKRGIRGYSSYRGTFSGPKIKGSFAWR
jgi:allophanate hydrolase subunit 2